MVLSGRITWFFKTQFCLAVALVAVALAPAHAELTDPTSVAPFGPTLLPGDKPLNLVECNDSPMPPNMTFGGAFKCKGASVLAGSLSFNGRVGQYEITITRADRKRFRTIGKANDYGFLDSVHTVDLNGDAQDDYILEFSFHGNGLAATARTMVFLLTSPEGFNWQVVPHVRSPAARHFYIDVEGQIRYMTARLASDAVKSMSSVTVNKPGSSRTSFWVFEPLIFSRANGIWAYLPSANYPMWVQYTNPAQNKPTELVPVPVQKRVTQSPLLHQRGGRMQPLG